jgi:hypothetical protein
VKKQTNVFFDGRYLNADHYTAMDQNKAVEAMVKDKAVKSAEAAREAYPKMQEQVKKDEEAYKVEQQRQADKQRALKEQRRGTAVVNPTVNIPSTLRQSVQPENTQKQPGSNQEEK